MTYVRQNCLLEYRDLEWKKIWNLPSKFLLTIEIQEIYLINIRRFYCTKTFLLWLMLTVHFVTVRKSFTYLSPAYILYVLWLLCYVKILFGCFDYPANRANKFYLIHLLISLANYHRHKSKCSNAKLSFWCFINESRQYFLTIQHSNNVKAGKTIILCFFWPLVSWSRVGWLCVLVLLFYVLGFCGLFMVYSFIFC